MSWVNLLNAIRDTLLMTLISTSLAYIIGFPIGLVLHSTSKNGVSPNKVINSILGVVVNVFRSIPCLLLILLMIPITNQIFGQGKWSGYWYSMIIPLVAASFAFVARMVEQSLSEVPTGVIEASKSFGATPIQIVLRVIITEAKPSLVSGVAVTIVSIIGYTSFAGYIAGGGLIVEAFNLGYYGTNKVGMWICVSIVVVIVQVFQELGLFISKKIDKRRKLNEKSL